MRTLENIFKEIKLAGVHADYSDKWAEKIIMDIEKHIPPPEAEILVPCPCQYPGSLGGDCDGSCMPFPGMVRWMPENV